ncbi:MAG: hypothetical protein KDA84_28935, partial [Planctomycetaceae bacterium]|nr:hypothetical protein [Planctomycetaceae bacterium]
DLPLSKCLLLLKCAHTLRVKEPYPEDPIAILDRLDFDYEPDTTDPNQIVSLEFPNRTCAAQVKLVERFPNVETVELSVKWLNSDTNDLEPLTRCKKLRKLVIPADGGRSVSDEDVETLVKCQSLEQLHLNTWGLSAKGIATLGKMTQLKSLLLERVDEKAISGLTELAACKGLEHFATALESDYDLEAIPNEEAIAFLSELPKLNSLKLEGELSKTTYQVIGGLDGLESLVIVSKKFKDDDLKLLVKAPNVKSFTLEGSKYKSGRPDVSFTGKGLASLGQWKSLESLSLTGLPLTDDSLKHLQAASNLQEVSLDGLPITYEGLIHLKDVPKLKTLHLDDLENLNRVLIDDFKEAAPQISVK